MGEYLPSWDLQPCAWGDAFGATLNKRGASVPSYARSGDASAALDAKQRARWMLLADDPLLELRVAPEESYLGGPPGAAIWARLECLDADASLRSVLAPLDLEGDWAEFVGDVKRDPEWQAVVVALTLSEASASAMMARALVAAFQGRLREHMQPELAAKDRDSLEGSLLAPLGGPAGGGITDWLLDRMTGYVRRRRGSLTDLAGPAAGDILRYQARGEEVRGLIGSRVNQSGARVLLAHSLGGIAAVDWLALGARPIDALITVGSQAAFFYEIDALVSLRFGTSLPSFFPQRWLNIYDESDMLSYPATGIFPGYVQDLRVDNGEPFPESHSAYFGNRRDVWPAVADFLGSGTA
ncbi:hypothetical protein OOZ63_10425 [Paucibacter sp. PLA-PC-4]|uniref:hypothetical protein n=1 Tax=Paucibacter sp. PLA-PC-4 TaxID=2993655 RepID=UPI002248D01B|nr:hypothetical protein [Paucibacter sp. PLA-PC-4]MCX2862256.1 hypothetical protein [Paucibacter sp. PLA-PC-4]